MSRTITGNLIARVVQPPTQAPMLVVDVHEEGAMCSEGLDRDEVRELRDACDDFLERGRL